MNTHSTNKTWVWIAIIVIVAAVGYFYFSGSSAPASTTLLQSSDTSADVGTQVLSLLQQIQSLTIDTSLFSDPGYGTLRDYSVVIPPVAVGRANPFAPLPGAPVTTGQAGQ